MADKFVNQAYISCVETAPTTLTFSQLTTGISLFARQAFLIHRINWYNSNRGSLLSADDYIQAALVTSNKMSGLGIDDPSVVFLKEFHTSLFGTAANSFLYSLPEIDDFSTLPGGGKIIPAQPIFLAVEGVSIAGPATVSVRIDFTILELKADEYIELVEAMRMVS